MFIKITAKKGGQQNFNTHILNLSYIEYCYRNQDGDLMLVFASGHLVVAKECEQQVLDYIGIRL